ncbi:ParB/RepB/Spo0J family partition protein [Paenibacillus urinalis]|uniref:ParB/RepB/Spo0J family partition protein n=1 Tax=Paenibacillus urinalis TaxID=521520 RepID=A0AAX3N0T8_9BACL|nr:MULTISPECIES: ParB/RepB/Spo0J family partition protein [Paenibacillus]WDH82699.1 ParB/RepB/Spo0J family partition protein [Paenibacillus urinalis]WDH98749.1 ParB/RepB/Spo0J family partition protein [Paenibacillus urinalis]WDI02443.1 ParB/RepB/Spo0J family partition protein [Paenibacillus urinalis]GAK41467.1 putative nuclease [Paenibacillus sp. TCA20]
MSKRLGKGLDALIPSLSINEDDKIVEIPLSQLRANPYQPRKTFDEDSIQELAESIRQHGVIQPIIVRSVLKGYEIIAGERRFRASQFCGKSTIPAVVRNFTEQQVMEIALIENLQRENLNAMEVAVAYQGLMDQFSLTQEELSMKVGKSRSHIANFLRLLALPEEVKEHVSRGTLSMGHARAIVGIKEQKVVKELAKQCIQQQWSVRELEEAVQQLDRKNEDQKVKVKQKKRDPYIENVEESLRNRFQTTVKIKANKDKGKIELNYYSQQDLERLLELLQLQ